MTSEQASALALFLRRLLGRIEGFQRIALVLARAGPRRRIFFVLGFLVDHRAHLAISREALGGDTSACNLLGDTAFLSRPAAVEDDRAGHAILLQGFDKFLTPIT